MKKPIQKALISVYHKEGLDRLAYLCKENNIEIYSTGGTQKYIEALGVEVNSVEGLTGFASILGGRVKTLHPKVFGGILYRSDNPKDVQTLKEHQIPFFDLVVVDLYPFQDTLQEGKTHPEIIEKIDIGGISLIRAAAKNYKDVLVVSSKAQYPSLVHILEQKNSSEDQRLYFAKQAFELSNTYDAAIAHYFSALQEPKAPSIFEKKITKAQALRYGENPHQKGIYYGNLSELFTQVSGKEMSYNNLLDIDAVIGLLKDIKEKDLATFIISKHNNACGVAQRVDLSEAYKTALSSDSLSAFGGVLATDTVLDLQTAKALQDLFFEVLIAPDFDADALELLQQKKKRILLKLHVYPAEKEHYRTVLNGVLWQDKDLNSIAAQELKCVTKTNPTSPQIKDLLFANTIAKHTKSNTIVLAKQGMLLGSGTGQTSRVDALKQAILKAQHFGLDLKDSVMASDAFFPFPDCVEIAHKAGITSVIQPGGSIKDQLSIDYCNQNNIAMVFTGLRHFKH